MHRMLRCALLTLLIAIPASAQKLPFAMDVPTHVDAYDPAIPTPESVIGHVIGTQHTVPHEVEDYFRAVAAVSDRVTMDVHAESYEGRNLIHAIVTSPANHARLDEILEAQQRVANDPDSVTDADIEDMPVILYQGYRHRARKPRSCISTTWQPVRAPSSKAHWRTPSSSLSPCSTPTAGIASRIGSTRTEEVLPRPTDRISSTMNPGRVDAPITTSSISTGTGWWRSIPNR